MGSSGTHKEHSFTEYLTNTNIAVQKLWTITNLRPMLLKNYSLLSNRMCEHLAMNVTKMANIAYLKII